MQKPLVAITQGFGENVFFSVAKFSPGESFNVGLLALSGRRTLWRYAPVREKAKVFLSACKKAY
jgi:hypothetical protein